MNTHTHPQNTKKHNISTNLLKNPNLNEDEWLDLMIELAKVTSTSMDLLLPLTRNATRADFIDAIHHGKNALKRGSVLNKPTPSIGNEVSSLPQSHANSGNIPTNLQNDQNSLVNEANQEEVGVRDKFGELFSQWLENRVVLNRGELSKDLLGHAIEHDIELAMRINTISSVVPWMIFKKLEVLEHYMDESNYTDHRPVVLLAGIKADLLRHFGDQI